ncbi:siderophore-interacting protein [Umezawaea sp. NPDC059074]|uniref:siderophore-interacting protein n=1 Tax=Umezawaea sp. NPDC059074 TaxID=3346716 RepID=UPI003683FB10
MGTYSALDQFQHKVIGKVASLVMASVNQRDRFEQFPMTVARVVALNDHLRRITFHAPEFARWRTSGADEYFGLLMPRGGELAFPVAERINVRAAIAKLPAATRPDLRWYTVRALRTEVAEIDVDFVLHADAHGPGSTWAAAAEPGAVAGFRACGSTYREQPAGHARLLVGDETALPALSAILEAQPGARAIVEVPDESYLTPVPDGVEFVYRGSDEPGSRALEAVAALPPEDFDYAWACGESSLATSVRRHLVKERGLDRRKIMFSGYWKRGQART